jgi:hypothetical protein
MIKLTDLLKELNIQPKPILGKGEQGTVYPLGKNRIIKKSNWYSDGMSKEELRDYELYNQHPDVFPHIYKITKHYVIMDKLDTSLKEFRDINLLKFMGKNGLWSERHYPEHSWTYNSKTGLYDYKYEDEEYEISDEDIEWLDPFATVYRDLIENNSRAFNHALQKAKEQGETKIYNTLKEILDLCIKINKAFKGQYKDVHKNNIGRDSSGKLKIFDVTLDDANW